MSDKYARVINMSEYKNIRIKKGYTEKDHKGKILFFYGNKFLVGEERGNKKNPYTFLGGTCEGNETIIECTAREVYEETIGIVSKDELINILLKLNKNNIITWRYNVKNKIITQYLFMVPWIYISKKVRKYNLTQLFNERMLLMDKIFNKEKVPAGKLSIDLKTKILSQLNLEIPVDRISKSFLKHFYEFQSLHWITMSQLLNPEVTNPGLVKKLNYVYASNTKNTFNAYFELIKNKRKKSVISTDSSGWKTRKKI